jgi:hypothetical protein
LPVFLIGKETQDTTACPGFRRRRLQGAGQTYKWRRTWDDKGY